MRCLLLLAFCTRIALAAPLMPLAPTGQLACYDATGTPMACGSRQTPLGGQDGASGRPLHYRQLADGSVLDVNTGLIWQSALGEKQTWDEARQGATRFRLGGHRDWRLPTIKELYSLMDFSGRAPLPEGEGGATPFINTRFFAFRYGERTQGERLIDVQTWSATPALSPANAGGQKVFGVNFADGRIKAYPVWRPDRGEVRLFVRYVRGPSGYGENRFVDHHNGTITDRQTGLMWMQADSGHLKAGPRGDGRLDWPQALAWAAALHHAGYNDWRLPNAKELQSLVDYSRSPSATGSAALSPLFLASTLTDEGGKTNYGFYWSSTTHLDGRHPGSAAVYLAFGEALGFMPRPGAGNGPIDIHGAGAQRSDPKTGDPGAYPRGFGPQGDVRRIYNFVRLVRNAP